jgi:hypothetical protein
MHAGLVLIASLTAGCAEELHPESIPTTRVTGVVRNGGQPVQDGWVELMPVDGTLGDLRTAPIGRDGSFEVTGVGIGAHLVDIAHASIGGTRPTPSFMHMTNVPIRRVVRAGAANHLTIDLFEETLRRRNSPRPAG